MLQALHHVANKTLRMHVADARTGLIFFHRVANGVHEVCFAKADTAINKERVVRFARIRADLAGRRARQLVAFTFDKVLKRKDGIQARDYRSPGADFSDSRGRRGSSCRSGLGSCPRANLNDQLGVFIVFGDQLENAVEIVLLQPVDHEPVRSKQPQYRAIVHGPCSIGHGVFIGFNSVLFNCTIDDGCVVRYNAVVDGVHLPAGFYVHSTERIGPDTDLASLPQVPADASEFSEDVARTNNALVQGYKAIQNEF